MYKNLQAELKRAGITETEMCKMLGLARSTFTKRMNNEGKWTLKEMDFIKEKINKVLSTEYTLDYLFELRS